jgi:S-adenosylmethionine:tRNA ribosyltransferase-isomerase
LKLEDFSFVLPKDLIASSPLEQRSSSRLLMVGHNLKDLVFSDLPDLLKSEDVLVINDTKVLNARLVGQKETGAKVELLIERVLDKENSLVQLRSNSRLREGDKISLSESKEFVSLIKKRGDVWEVKFSQPAKKIIDSLGLVPLPPYLKRDADTLDVERYQTVYADPAKNYSVAAPTAGFHFDNELLDSVMDKGVNIAKITLHIGMGTFKPIKSEIITEHKMHKESIELKQEAIDLINGSKEKGGRVITVGTTTFRCLESVAKMNKGALRPFTGETDLFIYPGFKFNVVDALITNFHLPKSTLLLLVSAFGGYEKMREAYKYAIQEKYRFYSYGDSMFINANPD